jgi:predicted HTH domain antitoxin
VELLAELGRRHIPINYGVDELREDVAALEKLSCACPAQSKPRP